MIMLNLWSALDDVAESHRLKHAIALTADRLPPAAAQQPLPQLIPVAAPGGIIGALLVPKHLARSVTRNGVPVGVGAHVVRHTDRLEYEGRIWWVAVRSEACAVAYEAGVHGEDVYCLITKARLQEGEMIVACPGPAGAECGAIYRQAAWEMVQQSNPQFRCPRCRFDPAAADWRPTLPPKSNLSQLLELAQRRRAGGAA